MKAVRLPVRLLRSTRCSCSSQRPWTSQFPSSLPQLPSSTRRSVATWDPPKAASEIQFPPEHIERNDIERDDKPREPSIRIIPTSPAYFTGIPDYIDTLLRLQDLLRKYEGLPVVTANEAPRVSWRSLADFNLFVGNNVKSRKYHKALHVLQRLNQIHPSVMPAEVQEQLNLFKRDIDPSLNIAKPIKIDKFGRAVGTGRRKSSTARAWVVEGDGEVLINGKPLTQAFGRVHDRESAIWALKATERVGKYNVWALVEGGGTTGQAEAMTLAVAKALLAHEPDLKPALRRAGCVTRDPRKVERKKPGHLKARKMPAWIAR